MKRCTSSYIIREMEIKITLQSQFLLIRLAKIHEIKAYPVGKAVGKQALFIHCWWEFKLVQPLRRAIWWYLSKLQMQTPFGPVIPLLGIYPTDRLTQVQEDTPRWYIAALFVTAKCWKQTRSVNRAFKIYHHISIQWMHMQLLKRREFSTHWYWKNPKIY